MRRKRVKIKSTGTAFTTGEVFSPSWDDLNYVVARLGKLGILQDLVPEIKITVILAHRGPMFRTVPLLLERADVKNYKNTVPFEILAMLWVVACFNYRWCKGAYPGTIKKLKQRKRGAIRVFDCPYCGQEIFEPNKRFKSRNVILKQYATALDRHAGECDDLLHLARGVK